MARRGSSAAKSSPLDRKPFSRGFVCETCDNFVMGVYLRALVYLVGTVSSRGGAGCFSCCTLPVPGDFVKVYSCNPNPNPNPSALCIL